MKGFAFYEVFALYFGITSCISMLFNRKVNESYMDEIFHVPQMQHYCDGNFSHWDPMITTLPGLYVTSLCLLQPLQWIYSASTDLLCSVFWLRAVNVVLSSANFSLLYLILGCFEKPATKPSGDVSRILASACIASLPVLYFFSFLYYTDQAALMFLLAAFLAEQRGLRWLGAVGLAMATLCRQTNVVWVVYLAGCASMPEVNKLVRSKLKQDEMPLHRSRVRILPSVPYRYIWLTWRDECSWRHLWTVLHTLLTKCSISELIGLILNMLSRARAYVAVALVFIVFVFVNGGIVVGARDDHAAGLHFAQLYYLMAFCILASASHFVSRAYVREFIDFLRKQWVFAIVFIVSSVFILAKFSHAHRYLLADNRHYMFYVWQRLLGRGVFVRTALAPMYLCMAWLVNASAKSQVSAIERTLWLICAAASLVPATLIEPRYFIVPYVLWRVRTSVVTAYSIPRLSLEMAVNVVVNAATIYVFLEKPFHWPDNTALQRFMW